MEQWLLQQQPIQLDHIYLVTFILEVTGTILFTILFKLCSVFFTLPSNGYIFSTPFAGPDSKVTVINGLQGQIPCFTIAPEQSILTENAGIVPLHCVTVTVWQDYSDNGIIDTGEPPISGIQVQLAEQGIVLFNNYTNSNGSFTFCNLLYSNATVNVFLPNSSWSFSQFTPSGSEVKTVNGLNGTTFPVFLGPTPSNYYFIVGIFLLDNIYFPSPSNGDSCLSTTTGSYLALGESVFLYPTVVISETTPISNLTVFLTGNMAITNTTVIIGNR